MNIFEQNYAKIVVALWKSPYYVWISKFSVEIAASCRQLCSNPHCVDKFKFYVVYSKLAIFCALFCEHFLIENQGCGHFKYFLMS